jgi:hypothetical protein
MVSKKIDKKVVKEKVSKIVTDVGDLGEIVAKKGAEITTLLGEKVIEKAKELGPEGLELAKDLGGKAFVNLKEASLVGYNISKELGIIGIEKVKLYTEEYVDKYQDLPKPLKIALMTAAAGGTVVASPFLIAALSEASIIAILSTLGGGAAAGIGFGVAGGVSVLILSCATASTLTALISSKIIKDPEVEKLLIALRDLHAVVEKNKVLAVKHMKKIKEYDEKVKDLLTAKIKDSNEIANLRGKLEGFVEQLQEQ